MGQARLRGTYEQRKEHAVFRNRLFRAIEWAATHPDETLSPEELANKKKLMTLLGAGRVPLTGPSMELSQETQHEAPHECKFCGAPSWVEPRDQEPPADYCHPGDHGAPKEVTGEQMLRVASRLEGTCQSLDDVLEDELGLELTEVPTPMLEFLDEQVMLCTECGWWSEGSAVDEDGVCEDCRRNN